MSKKPLPANLQAQIDHAEEKRRQTPFHVLVWGPGQSQPEGYEKRERLRRALENILGESQVHFSEDSFFQDLVCRYGLKIAEEIQAEAVDAIVVLDTSIGAHTEVAAFEPYLDEKGYVFVPEKYKNSTGMAATVYGTLRIFYYNEEEFQNCEHIRDAAKSFVQSRRSRKMKMLLNS